MPACMASSGMVSPVIEDASGEPSLVTTGPSTRPGVKPSSSSPRRPHVFDRLTSLRQAYSAQGLSNSH